MSAAVPLRRTEAATDRPLWRRLTVSHLLLVVPVLVGVVRGIGLPISDNSLLWHVPAGELQLRTGEVLRTDPFSFTKAGEPWRTQSWLADLLYGLLERSFGGLAWVWALLGLVAALTFLGLALAVYESVREPRRAALFTALAGMLGLSFLVPRPVVMANLLLVALVLVLQRPERLGWTVPFILWLWATIHGSFVIGLGLVVLEALRRRHRWAWWAGMVAFSTAAVTLTAHGWHVWGILFRFLASRGALSFIQEWGPPDFSEMPAAAFAVVLALVLAAATRGFIRSGDLWVVLPFALFGLSSFRALFPAAIVLAPWAAAVWPGGPREPRLVSPPIAAVNWGILLCVPLLGVALTGGPTDLDEEVFPVEAARYLEDGPAFHDDMAGGYLIYREWPERRVFIDDRAELYGGDFFRQFVAARFALRGWEELFDRHGIRQALVATGEPLVVLLESEGWELRYQDEDFVLYVAPTG